MAAANFVGEVRMQRQEGRTVQSKSGGIKRFSWAEVKPPVVRSILTAAYDASGQDDELQIVKRLPDVDLPQAARKALGEPPKRKHQQVLFDTLMRDWLPTASAERLRNLVSLVKQGLGPQARAVPTTTKAECVSFLQARNHTLNLKDNVWRAFLAAHKIDTGRPRIRHPAGSRASGSVWDLIGHGEPVRYQPYAHQLQAWGSLDDLAKSRGRRSGRLIIPTGGGKTATMVIWLLRRMQKRPRMRVLWIADQQELVDQAAREFAGQAATVATGFRRVLRTIHSRAGHATALADDDVDVICVTRQSLIAGGLDQRAKARIRLFMQRETVVVIDEAHHAVSGTYQRLIDFLWGTGQLQMLVGLTATPWPSGAGQTAKLHETFAHSLVETTTSKLIENGELARPILHTVETHELIEVTDSEITALQGRDVPRGVAKELNQKARNELAVRHWLERQNTWGKTLVFACSIEHAEDLTAAFRKESVTVQVVHSAAEIQRSQVLDEFRKATSPRVLVSVSMLLEGVDLPDARTAFLLRPTASPIVLRQMIGRVLRGVRAGGDPDAHLVDFVDQWSQDVGLLSPVDIPDVPIGVATDSVDGGEHLLPTLVGDDGHTQIGPDLARSLERAIAERVRVSGLDATLTTTRLVGFYDLTLSRIPVYEHTTTAWTDLAEWAMTQADKRGTSAAAHFDGLQSPTPVTSELDAFVDYCQSYEALPPFAGLRATIDTAAIARRLIAEEAMTESGRVAWLRMEYEATLARSLYPNLQLFIEAVEQEKLTLLQVIPGGATPERIRPRAKRPSQKLRRSAARELVLPALFDDVVTRGIELLLGESEYQDLLSAPLPEIDWTRRDISGAWAYWSWRTATRARGKPIIRINRLLQAPASQVPDPLLRYLIWHELCHHLTPGQGHDAEFRRLERKWPRQDTLSDELDTLHERYALPAAVDL